MTYGESYNPCGNDYGDTSHWYYFDNYTGVTIYGYIWFGNVIFLSQIESRIRLGMKKTWSSAIGMIFSDQA